MNCNPAEGRVHVLDLRGLRCPKTTVLAKLELEHLEQEDYLRVLVDDERAVDNLPRFFDLNGDLLVEVVRCGDTPPVFWSITAQKGVGLAG